MRYEIKGGVFPIVVCYLEDWGADDHRERLYGMAEPECVRWRP